MFFPAFGNMSESLISGKKKIQIISKKGVAIYHSFD